ncbi:FecR domain-containing protein [Deinococcus sp. SDU3-2]|uniref:FecR domain-containing protein n=1 Tax=Deinococcus terrestris TaxID=2651870 RepID=A0A7X1NTA7_9DEIO|nr:hypothetical protein [Deinococcus terrestris]MPY65253.1 FecR domain-containing protein [Deinococcus terrestris]
MSLPPVPRASLPLRTALLAALLGPAADAASGPSPLVKAEQLQGRAETLTGGRWVPLRVPATVTAGLRTGGDGAVWTTLRNGTTGKLLLGPSSRLRVTGGRAELQEGRFLLLGPLSLTALGQPVTLDAGAQARADLGVGGLKRVAVLAGGARVTVAGKATRLKAGQAIAVGTGRVTAFREEEAPWYAPRLTGTGRASVQATRGPVYLTAGGTRTVARVGATLDPGTRLSTGAGAWAEVGFLGGGYLRLQENSELTATAGPEAGTTTLGLLRGQAWNVVRSGAGQPALVGSTLRGSAFAVGVTGLRKTFGVFAAATGNRATPLPNSALDAQAQTPLVLRLDPVSSPARSLVLGVTTQPGAAVSALVGSRVLPLAPVAGQPGRFQLAGASLPEGEARVEVRADWRGQRRTRRVTVVVDRTAPTLTGLRAEREGRLLRVTGTLRDLGTAQTRAGRLTLTLRLGTDTQTRRVAVGPDGASVLDLPLPAPPEGTPVRVTVRDEAGNEAYAVLP